MENTGSAVLVVRSIFSIRTDCTLASSQIRRNFAADIANSLKSAGAVFECAKYRSDDFVMSLTLINSEFDGSLKVKCDHRGIKGCCESRNL